MPDALLWTLDETRVGGNCLPATFATDKSVSEPNDDIVGSAFELANAVSTSSHNGCIPENPRLYVVDRKAADLVHARLEHLNQHSRPVGHAAVWPGARPFWRD